MSRNPRIWCNFTVKSDNGDVKLRIQDMPTERSEDVANLYNKYFSTEETIHKAAGVGKSKEALLESKGIVSRMMGSKKHAVVICCKDEGDTGEVVAVSVMAVERRDDPDIPRKVMKTKEMTRMFELVFGIFSKYDAVKQLNMDSIYGGRGIVVHPDYRGLGIAQKLFNNRRRLCAVDGVPITGAWMTSFGSQKAAERDGWETVFEISYDELGKEFDVIFEEVPKTCKFMIAQPIT